MRHNLLILAIMAAASGAGAQDVGAEFDFVMPEPAVIQICAVDESTQDPVPFVSISVEYADTIVNAATDEKGLLDFTPLSFPLTLTANSEGMMEASYGIFEQPDEPLTILMTREPAEDKKVAMAIK
ncbi:MAG: hypothetical protein K2L22_04580 [Muribaculaceae bacterium]|nr:hypothetical protein [Muribaculaceae bacterium]